EHALGGRGAADVAHAHEEHRHAVQRLGFRVHAGMLTAAAPKQQSRRCPRWHDGGVGPLPITTTSCVRSRLRKVVLPCRCLTRLPHLLVLLAPGAQPRLLCSASWPSPSLPAARAL